LDRTLLQLILITIIVQLYRLYVLLNAQIDLYVDEAYYWGWSKELAFGYYSKPPMIAWIIALASLACGDSLVCIKLPALLIYPITTIFVYLIAKRLFNPQIAFSSALAFITLPAVSMSSLIISTDVPLLLFWAMALYLFLQALERDRLPYWIGAGIAAGAGLLSKYTMILFLPSAFFYLWLEPRYRHHLTNPRLYTAILIAALIYFPNFAWNATHHFISFLHTKDISKIEELSYLHFDKLLEFWGAQMAVFGPIFFPLFLYLLVRPVKEPPFKPLYAFSLPFFATISLQALLARALANWAAPTYITATILVVAYLIQRRRIWLVKGAIAINIALALLFYHYHQVLEILQIPLQAKIDPYKRVRGYSQLATRLQPIVQAHPEAILLFDNRSIMAEMIYYLRPHPFDAVMFNPERRLSSQYHLTTDMNHHIGQNFLYVTTRQDLSFQRYFDGVELLETITIQLYPDLAKTYRIYYLRNFKGY